MHLRLRDEAREDLREIQRYLEPRNERAWNRVRIEIFTLFDQLKNFPFLGRVGRVEGTREISLPRYPYYIVYSLPDAYHIDVEAIFHERQQYPFQDE